MRSLLKFWIALLLAGATFAAAAAHTQARLLLAAQAARPGDTVLAGIRLQMDPEWHTYWKNSGASGIPTTLEWTLPAGVTAGAIQWPVPEKLTLDDLTTYVYLDEVVLLVPFQISPDAKPGPLELRAKAAWLECKETCLPGGAEISATLEVGAERKPSPDGELIAAWQKKLPQPGGKLSAQAAWEKPADGDTRPLVLEWAATAAGEPDFFPQASDDFEVQGKTEILSADAGRMRLRKLVKKFSGDWPKQISGVLVQKSALTIAAFDVSLPVSGAATESIAATAAAAPPLWQMLLYAFLGGLILNVMPCVLPVIALKILGFVSESKSDPRHVRLLGLVYALGVAVSFLALAALVIGVKAAGHRAGWGMQFGNPQFLVLLTTLVTLVALNLFGLFEVNLGGQVLGAAGTLAARQGVAGAFFNGVLATILATPCTAPFLGAAVGFAFAQGTAVILLIFLTVAAGLASPYVLLSWQPAWLKFLPKPDAWMEKFKIAMGFPMLATAVWLLNLAGGNYGKRAWWLGIFLVTVALAAWVFGEFAQRGRTRRGLAGIVALALLAGGYGLAIERELDWRAPLAPDAAAGSLRESPEGIDWQPWTPAAVTQAQSAGKAVLVDFTADWCLTCQANKKIAIETAPVRAKLKALGAVALLGDYTHFPEAITAELQRYGRAGVPLVLVFPGRAGAPPAVLPELLAPNSVLNALDGATK